MDSAKKIYAKFILNLKYYSRNFFSFIFSRRFIFSHYFMMTLIFLLTLTSIYLFYSRFRVAEAGDVWFNDLWKKRQKVVITNISDARVTNFIGEAVLDGATLISSGFLNSNCSDIRVVDATFTVLNHWVDPQSCNTSQMKVYFKIPILYDADDGNSGANTFYVYYGYNEASLITVAQDTLFVATIPNLRANYNFESMNGNVVYDNSGLQNNAIFINTTSTKPDGTSIINDSTFPEGYNKNAFFFNGYSVFLSTPIKMLDLTKAYTLLTFIKPEGTRANGYMVQGESMGKMFNFENILKGGANPCTIDEYQEGDGVSSCNANGLRYTPDSPTQKKTGSYTFYYDYYWNKITRPSLSVTFNGTTQSLFTSDPTNFTPLLSSYSDFGYFYKIKPYGNSGDFRTIHSWGNTSPGNSSYSLDYTVCTDGSLSFSLDYNNSRDLTTTLATPCLNNVSPSTKISSNAGKYTIYANANKWLNIVTAQIENKRYIFVNGILMASDNTTNVVIARNVPMYLGRASNSNKSNFKGEIDEFNNFGADLSWFRTYYYTGGSLNTSVLQIANNIHRKSYVIFGNNSNNFFEAGFSNHGNSRYPTATAISNFNYNFNTSDSNDFYQQYGGNIDNTLNNKVSFISTTFDLFSGSWYRYYTDFDDTRNSITSNYQFGSTNYSNTNSYTNTNSNGVLTIGAYVNTNEDGATYPSEFFLGGIDDVFIYSATLSATQLTYHSSPWNGYASYGKSLWQADLPSSARGTITINQNFSEETRSQAWYDKNYPFRVQVNVSSLPVLTIPNFQVSFNFNTSTPISNQRMNSDCSGIIVVDDFLRQLPFWIEGCNTTSSKVYVRMNPDDTANSNASNSVKGGANQKLFIYYGNEKSTAKTYPPSKVFDFIIPNLEIAYTFEDDTATTSFDKSGNGRNLTKSNVTTTSSGAYGVAPLFNGSSGYGSRPNPDATIRSSWSGITHLFWMKVQGLDIGTNRNPIVQQYPGTDNRYLNYAAIGSGGFTMRTQLYGPTDLLQLTGTNVNDFNFFGVSWGFGSGNTVKSFYNYTFSSINNGTNYQSFPDTGDGLFIGAFCCNPGVSNYWTGAIDEVRLFSRQLSDAEINYYTYNTSIGSSRFATSGNTCNQINNFCMRSFVTPSYPSNDLLGKYNSNVVITTNAETRINTPYIYFKFNEGKGLVVGDSANRISSSSLGDIRQLTLLSGNEPTWSPEEKCIEGQCLYFDGMNDYVDVQTIPGGKADTFLTLNSDYAYSFWIKPLSNPNTRQTVISFGESTTGLEGYTVYLDGAMRVYNYGSRAGILINSSASTLPINKWSHVSIVNDDNSNSTYFYINGSLDSSFTNSSVCSLGGTCAGNNLNLIHIGGNAAGTGYQDDYFRGYIDEFKLYKSDLKSNDVLDDYRKGLNTLKYNLSVDQDTVTNFNLMAYYPFDEIDRIVAFDYSDNNFEASYPGSSNLNSAGIFNNAYISPGGTSTNTVQIYNNSLYNLTSQVTYSIWSKISGSDTGERYILFKGGTGGFNISYNNSTTKYSANICGSTLVTASNFANGSWDNIVLTSNSKKAKLFVNSVLEDEEYCFNSYVGNRSNTAQIRIGGDGNNGGGINATLDEFRIYDNYLSNRQVQLLFSYKPTYQTYGNGPAAFYKLDASSGTTTAVDASGNNNTLNMIVPATNQNSWTTFGKIGNSYNFVTRATGTLNLFSIGSSTVSTGLTRPHTLMAWVAFSEPFYGRYAMGGEPVAISIGDASTGNLYSIVALKTSASNVLFPSFFQFRVQAQMIDFSSPYLYTTTPPKTPIWYHVAATFDGYLRKLYVNGELVNVDTGVTRVWSIASSAIGLGSATGNYNNTQYQYMGLLDEAKIYNYARTQDQIKMDMRNSGTSPALNSTFYNSIRSNQKPSALNTSGDSTIYPLIDIGFDSYFKTNNSILITNVPLTLEEINFNSIPENVQNYQVRFSIPMSTYNAKNFSEASCSNLILTDEKGRRVPYWAEPGSCRNGIGMIFPKFQNTSNNQYLKVSMDPYVSSSGQARNYANSPYEIFDSVISDLVIAYNFEDDTLTTSFDKSGNDNNLTKKDITITSQGAFGNAQLFNGSSSYGSVPNPDANIRLNWSGITQLMWIKVQGQNVLANRNAFAQEIGTNRYQNYAAIPGTGGYTMHNQIYSTTNILSLTGTPVNNFNFYGTAWKFGSGNTVKSYMNTSTSVLSNGTSYQSFPDTGNGLFIGASCCTLSTYWSGAIDEIRVFKKQLTDSEVNSYISNSTVLGTSVLDSTNTCNIPNSWCARSYVTPSFPGNDILGKYNSLVFPVYRTFDQPVFSLANSGAQYASGQGVRGGAAYFFTSGSEINMSLGSNRFNFTQGSDAAISFYIKTTETGVGSIASSTGLKINKLNGNTVQFSGAKFNIISTRTLPANSWAHVFFQKNGQTGVFELYLDNNLQGATYSDTNSLDMSDLKFTVTQSRPYYLDELKIYNTVLSPALIFNLYNNGGFGIKMGGEDSSTCATGSTNNCIDPTDSFLFNESSGETAFNSIINRNDLTLGKGTSRANGYIGKGLQFSYLDTQTFATNLINASGKGSFSFWYKADFQGSILSGKGINISPYPGNLFVGASDLVSNYPGSSWGAIYGYSTKDPWHHINVNYDNSVTPGQLKFYLDGVNLLSTTYTKDNSVESWMSTFGFFDNLNFYNYQRDDSQVAQEYARGKPFAYFKFEECAGTKFYNSNSNLYKPLQNRENGSRADTQAFLNTGLNITRPTNALNFNTNLCQTGKYNNSYYFDGDTYLEGNDYHSRVYNSEGNATITFWIDLDSNATQNVNLIGSYDGTNAHLIKLINRDISIYLNKNASTTLKLTGTTDLPTSGWAHVALVFENGTNYKIYINGQLDASGNGNFESVLNTCTGGTPVVCTNRPFIVGSGFKGKLDELKIYNYPLTQKQIKIDMNQNSAIRVE